MVKQKSYVMKDILWRRARCRTLPVPDFAANACGQIGRLLGLAALTARHTMTSMAVIPTHMRGEILMPSCWHHTPKTWSVKRRASSSWHQQYQGGHCLQPFVSILMTGWQGLTLFIIGCLHSESEDQCQLDSNPPLCLQHRHNGRLMAMQ